LTAVGSRVRFMPRTETRIKGLSSQAIQHVVIIVKENHCFDNYFGTFPGADGMTMPRSPNPPLTDPDHRHSAWLTRKTTAVKQQFVEADIPAYFAYARLFTLCDRYFTEVTGPSWPNHLMLIAADSPFIDNPKPGDTSRLSTSLPANLEKTGLSWKSYGGTSFFQYITGISTKNQVSSAQFATDAAAGNLPNVSWLYAPAQFDEHPPDSNASRNGNVTQGSQWTVNQVNALVKGGLWQNSVIFITWDCWGGWWDHVDPPYVETWNQAQPVPSYKGTQFRYGSRVGCLVLSPYAKRNYISKTQHSHVSLVKFCETLFNLPALNQRDANSDSISDCFDFTQTPAQSPPTNP
jgi:phospholipase C